MKVSLKGQMLGEFKVKATKSNLLLKFKTSFDNQQASLLSVKGTCNIFDAIV